LCTPATGSADPRYEVSEGRRTPPFYRAEVEHGRRLVLRFIQRKRRRDTTTSMSSLQGYLSDRDMDYCVNAEKKPPTLALMPVATHGTYKHTNIQTYMPSDSYYCKQ